KHQQKLVQLENAHHSEISELKISALAMTSKIHMEHVVSEVEKKEKLLQMEKREKESLMDTSLRQRKMKHLDHLRELKQNYVTQLQELEAQYMQKIKDMVEIKMKETREECEEIDTRMKAIAARVVKEHEDAWKSIKDLKCLMEDVPGEVNVPTTSSNTQAHLEALKKKMERQERMLIKQVQKRKHLEESLLEMKSKLSESDSKLTVQRKAMADGWK
ncbi:hypothetical protein INR49_017148, partial [Caranx melampygus]